jgi:hypothetical protein
MAIHVTVGPRINVAAPRTIGRTAAGIRSSIWVVSDMPDVGIGIGVVDRYRPESDIGGVVPASAIHQNAWGRQGVGTQAFLDSFLWEKHHVRSP